MLFDPLFGAKVNTKQIFSTSLVVIGAFIS